MSEKDQARAKEQAKAQLESIVDMVKRFEHCQSCDGEDCDLTDEEIYAGVNLYYKEGAVVTEEERREYHDEEAYTILLCTGGPACRIIGDLDEHQQPDTAKLEYQDWFTPWVEYYNTTPEEGEALLSYARQFYFSS